MWHYLRPLQASVQAANAMRHASQLVTCYILHCESHQRNLSSPFRPANQAARAQGQEGGEPVAAAAAVLKSRAGCRCSRVHILCVAHPREWSGRGALAPSRGSPRWAAAPCAASQRPSATGRRLNAECSLVGRPEAPCKPQREPPGFRAWLAARRARQRCH